MLGKVGLFVGVLCLAGLVGELAVRVRHYVKYGQGFRFIVLDEELGWRSAGSVCWAGRARDEAGTIRDLRITTDPDGFRRFGDLKASRRKVLFIGDSFTQAVEVSDEEAYYSVLARKLGFECFAYGAGGYGTLQESMILDRYFDVIRPDALVLQLCSNDFINNRFELELRSRRNNNGLRRPYLDERGEVVRLLPKRHAMLREFANRYARLLYVVLSRIDALRSRSGQTVEDEIARAGAGSELFVATVKTTDILLKRIRARVPGHVPIYAFISDGASPFYDEWRRLVCANGMEFIDGVPGKVMAARNGGLAVMAEDRGHWNPNGHLIVAEAIAPYLTVLKESD